MSATEHSLEICDPCREDVHGECVGTPERPCSCLVCEGERIGDRVLGQTGGNYPRKAR